MNWSSPETRAVRAMPASSVELPYFSSSGGPTTSISSILPRKWSRSAWPRTWLLFIWAALFNGFNVRDDGFDIFKGLNENTGFMKVFIAIILVQAVIVNAGLIPVAAFGWIGNILSCVPSLNAGQGGQHNEHKHDSAGPQQRRAGEEYELEQPGNQGRQGELGLGYLTDGWTTWHLFSVYRSPLADPLAYVRFFGLNTFIKPVFSFRPLKISKPSSRTLKPLNVGDPPCRTL